MTSYLNGSVGFGSQIENPTSGTILDERSLTDLTKTSGNQDFENLSNETLWQNFTITDPMNENITLTTETFGTFTGSLYSDSGDSNVTNGSGSRIIVYNGTFQTGTLFENSYELTNSQLNIIIVQSTFGQGTASEFTFFSPSITMDALGTGQTISVDISNGQVSSSVLSLDSTTSFNFTDASFNITIPSNIFGGTGSNLNLSQDLTAPGTQIKVTKFPANYKFIFAQIDQTTKATISALTSFDFGFVLKVVDLSGTVISTINNDIVNLEIYIDQSGNASFDTKNKIDLYVDGDLGKPAGTFTKQTSGIAGKYKYSGSLLRGDGGLGGLGGVVAASSGSDPHITTLSGIKYDFHPSTRRNYTLYQSKEVKVSSHFTGYKSGVFYDKVMIDFPNKEKMEVDFNKQRIKGKSSFVSIVEQESIPLKYKNHTHNKSVGKEFKPKSLTKVSVQGKNPLDMYIDYQTRYVHFRFPDTLPATEEISGLIVEPATRLD